MNKINKVMLFLGAVILFAALYQYLLQYSDLMIDIFTDFRYSGEGGLKFSERIIFGFLAALNIFIRRKFVRALLTVIILIALAFVCSISLTYLIKMDFLSQYTLYNEVLILSLIYSIVLLYFERASFKS